MIIFDKLINNDTRLFTENDGQLLKPVIIKLQVNNPIQISCFIFE